MKLKFNKELISSVVKERLKQPSEISEKDIIDYLTLAVSNHKGKPISRNLFANWFAGLYLPIDEYKFRISEILNIPVADIVIKEPEEITTDV